MFHASVVDFRLLFNLFYFAERFCYRSGMEVLPATPDNIKRAAMVLKAGGVIAHPADTCFGLAGDLMNPRVFKKIMEIKDRDPVNPMSIMLPVVAKIELEQYGLLTDFTREIADKLLPGPVTLLLPKGPRIPEWYFPETDLIGIRIPYDTFTQDLLIAFKAPLITTSANLSDGPLCHTHREVLEAFRSNKVKPDLVFEGHLDKNPASTVILPQKNKVKITRPGAITAKRLEGILGVPVVE
ncbi:MAG: L-threonylcarbamoyladenylate synthase [Candidatus Peregrinibacteria bacterium]